MELEKLKIESIRLYFFEMKNTLFCFLSVLLLWAFCKAVILSVRVVRFLNDVWLFLLENKRIKNAR